MAKHAFGQREARTHQKSWPINRVEAHDVFANHVQVGRPMGLKMIRPCGRALIREA